MLADITSKYRAGFAPGAATELRAQRNLTRRVVLRAGSLIQNERRDLKGVGARAYRDGVYGFSSAAELTEGAVKAVLERATENAALLARRAGRGLPDLPPIARAVRPRDEETEDLPQKYYVDYLRALDSYIVGKYPSLESRNLVAYVDSMEKQLTTSDGYVSHTFQPRGYVYIFLTVKDKDGLPVEVFEPVGGSGGFAARFSDPALLYPLVDKLYEMARQKAEGVHARAGERDVILSGELAGILAHEAVGHTVEADLVLGGSVAGPMLTKQVASPLVSMTDFAHSAFGEAAPLPVFVDDEGVAAQDAPLIREGILTGFMHSRQSAQHFGAEPLGNARAWSFRDEPLIRMRNTAVHPGRDRLQDTIAAIDDGYYLIHTGNGQADSTGEFMFGITMGYEIKGGKVGRAIDTTISGVALRCSGPWTWWATGSAGPAAGSAARSPCPWRWAGPNSRRVTRRQMMDSVGRPRSAPWPC